MKDDKLPILTSYLYHIFLCKRSGEGFFLELASERVKALMRLKSVFSPLFTGGRFRSTNMFLFQLIIPWRERLCRSTATNVVTR